MTSILLKETGLAESVFEPRPVIDDSSPQIILYARINPIKIATRVVRTELFIYILKIICIQNRNVYTKLLSLLIVIINIICFRIV